MEIVLKRWKLLLTPFLLCMRASLREPGTSLRLPPMKRRDPLACQLQMAAGNVHPLEEDGHTGRGPPERSLVPPAAPAPCPQK